MVDKEQRLKELYARKAELDEEIQQHYVWQYTIKIFINRVYGYFGNKRSAMGDPDIARSITLTGQDTIKKSNAILVDYISKLAGKEVDPIIYNDTDSVYTCITSMMEARGLGYDDPDQYAEIKRLAFDVEDHLNTEIEAWARDVLNSADPRLVFKCETICDKGFWLAKKKRYVLHKIYDEGVDIVNYEDGWKYTGVDVKRSTMPKAIKPFAKKIIQHMITSQSRKETNAIFQEAYEVVKKMPIDQLAMVSGLNSYSKYAGGAIGLKTIPKTPMQVRAAIYYNHIVKELGIDMKYECLGPGDKVKYIRVKTPNKWGINVIGFKGTYPPAISEHLHVDYATMFEKLLAKEIDRFYATVHWESFDPSMEPVTDVLEMFGLDD